MSNETEKKVKKISVKKITLAALFAALVTVATTVVKIPTGINDGYLHFGDSMIYLAGCLLGPIAALSAAIGGALADILSGVPTWAPATAIIKACNAVPFIVAMHYYVKSKGKHRIVNLRTVLMTIVSGLITAFGYLLAEGIMYSFPTAWTSFPISLIQATGSAVIFLIIGCALDAAKIQRFIK